MLRLLLVEDEAVVAMMVEDMLADLGCRSVLPVGSVAAAMSRIADSSFDGALLDVNIGGEPVFPVARALRSRGIPFAFVTGYGQAGIPGEFADRPVLQKPFGSGQLAAVVTRTFGTARPNPI